MIYLELFLTFLEIGAVSFGGGYAMISMIREKCLSNDWLTNDEIMNFIAVSESTPGPIAVNMATFVGSSQGGLLGSLAATVGVVLPSFIIILLISRFFQNFLKYRGFKSLLSGIRPVVVGLILATAITMFLSVMLGITTVGGGFSLDYFGLLIFALVALGAFAYKKIRGKNPSPILLIVFSAVCGAIFYSI